MIQVFIAYSNEDSQFLEQLQGQLKTMRPSWRIWHYKGNDGLVGGDLWWDGILDAIAKSSIFIYVLSNESIQSAYCQAEFREAYRLRKRIITIQARDTTDIPPELSDIQWIDMKNGIDKDSIERLEAALDKQAKAIKKTQARWSPKTPKPDKDPHVSVRPKDSPDVDTPPLKVPEGGKKRLSLAAQLENANARIQEKVAQIEKLEKQTRIYKIAIAVGVISFIAVIAYLAFTSINNSQIINQGPVDKNTGRDPVERIFDGVDMVLVPRGCFMMGSARGMDVEHSPREQCFDEPFWIDKYEVTQAQFQHLGGIKQVANHFTGDNHPVDNITWFEARDFCALRDSRLPTEAEWEYAARGPENWLYPWGNVWNPAISWNRTETINVGSIKGESSWVGAFDLSGNIREWTSSLYTRYPYDPDAHEGDTGNNQEALRVVRGGPMLADIEMNVTMSYRGHNKSNIVLNDVGFRCVRDYDG